MICLTSVVVLSVVVIVVVCGLLWIQFRCRKDFDPTNNIVVYHIYSTSRYDQAKTTTKEIKTLH